VREELAPPPKTKEKKKRDRSKKHHPDSTHEDIIVDAEMDIDLPETAPETLRHAKKGRSPQNGAGISILRPSWTTLSPQRSPTRATSSPSTRCLLRDASWDLRR
jgi:hypothetical protein